MLSRHPRADLCAAAARLCAQFTELQVSTTCRWCMPLWNKQLPHVDMQPVACSYHIATTCLLKMGARWVQRLDAMLPSEVSAVHGLLATLKSAA